MSGQRFDRERRRCRTDARCFVRDCADDHAFPSGSTRKLVVEQVQSLSCDQPPIFHRSRVECIANQNVQLAELIRDVKKLRARVSNELDFGRYAYVRTFS